MKDPRPLRQPLTRHGLRVVAPAGWSASLTRREADAGSADSNPGPPLLHAATFPLPPGRGDFGSGAAASMAADDILVVLMEYDASSAAQPLFAVRGLPRPRPSDFSPHQLQRTRPGQSGYQRFFTWQGRPFCLYVILGSHAQRAVLVPRLHAMLDGVSASPSPTASFVR